MDKVAKLKKNPSKVLAVEMCAFNPEMTVQQIADKIGVSKGCIENWKRSPEFIDAVYDRYMLQFGMEIPQVLDSMVREAKAGNVQAGRLILEHSGKLVKNINVTIDSPFEKFLKNVPSAEIVEDAEIIEAAESVEIDFSELPPRNTESQYKREINEKVATKQLIKKAEKNAQQKVWYHWRKRAKAVGISPLKGRRPTPAQRQDWENSIIEAEKIMRENGTLKEKPKPFFNKDKNDWETPQSLFDELHKEFNFTLDPCASKRTHKCKKYYTKEDDGLSKDWSNEIVFMNPPYSNGELAKWIEKAYNEHLKGVVVVCLIPSYTSTKYWHKYIEGMEVRFLKGKLKFNNRNYAPFPSCVVVFRKLADSE